MNTLKVATVASETVWKDIGKNIELVEQHVSKVKKLYPETQVILFPEISLAGFVVDSSNADIAESLESGSVKSIQAVAKKYNVALVCGMIESNKDSKPFNTQFVVSKEGELVTSYRKNHLFTQSAEPDVYTPGDELVSFELEGWKCGLSTCFDIRFPRLFEAYKKVGVEVVFSGFNWVEGRNKPESLKVLVKARAHENQYFMVVVDRSGADPNTKFHGLSVIANPFAEDIAKRNGIYSYAELNKDEIKTISNLLPLEESYKSDYKVTGK